MQYGKNLLAAGLLLSLSTVNAQAALQSRAGGTMVYDTDLDITWVADGNLFKTLADASGDVAAYVQSIITANGGVIYDTPNPFDGNDGIYDLSASDFNFHPISGVNGVMNWFGAQAWVNTLNYGGYNDWRLPNAGLTPVMGYESNSEMGHLFYNELGGTAGSSIPNTFINNQFNGYWSGTEYAPDPSHAWYFSTLYGFQDNLYKNYGLGAFVVRTGDVATVPVPGAVWLFGSVMLGLLGLKRRGSIR